MSNTNITLHWSVPLEIWGEELLSLTWSAIILEIWGLKVLTDIWLFQWWKWAEAFNTTNVDFLSDIDAVIITHPHVDHIWRLPLLYKYGFRGPIYMTSASRKITKEMLLDCYKIQDEEKIIRVRRNEKLGFRLRKALRIKQSLLALKKNNFAEAVEKQSIMSFLNKELWEWFNRKKVLKEITDYLDFHKVKSEEDIGQVIARLKETLFWEEDMAGVIWLIQSLDHWEEKIISSKRISSKNKNAENQEILDNLPERIANWFKWEIVVGTKSEKRKLRAEWNKLLQQNIRKVFDSNVEVKKLNNSFKKQLLTAFAFCESHKFLDDKSNINTKDYKTSVEFEWMKKLRIKYKKLLDEYNIKTRDDIERLVVDKERLIDIFKIDLPFYSKDIDKAVHSLKVENKSNNLRHVTWLTLTDAAHVVWSASVNIISWIVKWKINNICEINWDATSVFLSGDLWRIKNNRLGQPELAAFPVNHLQIESTYAWKEHRDREESEKDLIDSIEKSKWNVLISVFAQQRLQEILMTLLEAKVKNPSILDNEILIDAPLWDKLTDVYIDFEWEVFNLLDPGTQIEIFWKQVFRFLWEGDWKEIYKEKNKDKKYIILASSWMIDWWAVMNHLPLILENPDATLLAPGYLCNGTLWNEIIIQENEIVTVWWEKYEVKCNKKFIDGFSSHISHSEILEYITAAIKNWKLKLDSTISLNHWMREWQEKLKKAIEVILKELDRTDIKVIIPEMFETYDIDTRKTKKDKKKLEALTAIKWKPKWVTPSFLLWDIKSDNESVVVESQEVIELRRNNEDKITNIRNYSLKNIGKILKDKHRLVNDFLKTKMNGFKNNKLFSLLSKISKMSEWQKKSFYNLIDMKLKTDKKIKSDVSALSNKVKNINILYDKTSEFKYDIDYVFIKEVDDYENEISKLNDEITEIQNELWKNDNNWLIESKNRRIRYLKTKIQELNYIISWDTSSLENEIELLKISIAKTKDDFVKFKDKEFEKGNKKNKENRDEWNSFQERISDKKNKIAKLDEKIIKIKNIRIHFESRLKSNIPVNFHDELTSILNKMWKWDEEAMLLLRELCDNSILDIKSKIAIHKWELWSHISIDLHPSKPVFNWRNLHKEIFGWSVSNFDAEKLIELLKDDFFWIEDKQFIIKCIEEDNKILNNNGWTNLITKPLKRLKKFFKDKQDLNNDLWVELGLSIEEIEKQAHVILRELFRWDYYEKYIYPNFDIYLFLKSQESFYDYIKRQYNLEKLKWYRKNFSEVEKVEEEVDYYYKEDLNRLSESNLQAKDTESLEQIDHWIENLISAIKEQIEKIRGN